MEEIAHKPADASAAAARHSFWAWPIVRFAAWWAGLFGLLGGTMACPCCGQASCPGGPASAGLLGGLFAVILVLPRWIRNRLGTSRQK
jgi:hypothetical protein